MTDETAQQPVRLITAVRRSVDAKGNRRTWDVLQCGHLLPATGGSEDRRPCPKCTMPGREVL